jgi:hypothetical protein
MTSIDGREDYYAFRGAVVDHMNLRNMMCASQNRCHFLIVAEERHTHLGRKSERYDEERIDFCSVQEQNSYRIQTT